MSIVSDIDLIKINEFESEPPNGSLCCNILCSIQYCHALTGLSFYGTCSYHRSYKITYLPAMLFGNTIEQCVFLFGTM